MKNRHLKELAELGWMNVEHFISMPDGNGKWIFGDGTYALRMNGEPVVKEGNADILLPMIREIDKLANSKYKKPITLPSIGYLKRKNRAKLDYRIPIKLPGHEIFVNSKLLYEMLKVLHNAEGYSVEMRGFNGKSKVDTTAIYLKADNGDGVLCPLKMYTRRVDNAPD